MSQPEPHNSIRDSQVHNRLSSILLHTTKYAFEGVARLAKDAGVSRSAVSKIIHGERRPAYFLVTRLVSAIEADLGVKIDPRDIFRENGEWPTKYPCAVAGCSGCIPPWAYDDEHRLLPEYQGLSPGQWEAPIAPHLPFD